MATRLEARLLDESEHASWDALVADAAGGTLFHRSAWARLLGDVFGRRARFLAVFRNGTLVGGCPVYERRMIGLSIAAPPIIAGYSGALVSLPEVQRAGRLTSETEQVLSALEAAMRRHYAYAFLAHDPGVLDARPFLWNGWKVSPRFTYRVRLAPEEEMLAAFEQQVRTKIRKAEKSGLTCHRVAAPDDSLGTYAFAYARHGVTPPVPLAMLAALAEGVARHGFGRLYVARDREGQSRAFEVILLDGATAYAWLGGADAECLRQGGYSLLHSKVFADLAPTHREIDLLGANTPTIATFKRSFGGALVPYWETAHASLAGRAYVAARALAARLRAAGNAGPVREEPDPGPAAAGAAELPN